MEEKKFDLKSIIGFVLIFILLLWVMNNNRPTQEELAKRKAEQEQAAAAKNPQNNTATAATADLGAFAYGNAQATAKDGVTVIENKDVKLTINNKGGDLKEVLLKQFKTYESTPVYLIKDKNAIFALNFKTTQGQELNTQQLYFEPSLTQKDGKQLLSMKVKTGENSYLEYVYTLPAEGYMVDVAVRSQGLSGVLNTQNPIELVWGLKARRMEKSVTYENRYTQSAIRYADDKINRMSQGGNSGTKEEQVSWVAYKQHLFTSVLISDSAFANGDFLSYNIANEESKDVKYTKNLKSTFPLKTKGGELSESLHFYFGPSDYNVLKQYNDKYELTELIPLGWGIFGWLNKWLFIPLYNFLANYFSVGLVIILMTIIVRLLLSPIVYKSYVSQAKMKVLRPEIEDINKKQWHSTARRV